MIPAAAVSLSSLRFGLKSKIHKSTCHALLSILIIEPQQFSAKKKKQLLIKGQHEGLFAKGLSLLASAPVLLGPTNKQQFLAIRHKSNKEDTC